MYAKQYAFYFPNLYMHQCHLEEVKDSDEK